MADFYLEALQRRLALIETERAAALADLQSHRFNNDHDGAGEAEQRVADLRASQRNLQDLANEYVASQQPPEPVPQTKEELMVKDWSRMTPDDGLALARESKYGRSLDWNDPYVRKGYQEAQRRRNRGE
jgi:hypothetical protein